MWCSPPVVTLSSLPPAGPDEEVAIEDDRPDDALSPKHQAETEVEKEVSFDEASLHFVVSFQRVVYPNRPEPPD